MKYSKISFKIEGEIAVIGLGVDSKVSRCSLDILTLKELGKVLVDVDSLSKSRKISSVIFTSHNEYTFLLGSDFHFISTFNKESEGSIRAQMGQQVLGRIESLDIPSVAIVNGRCISGGVEFILACDHVVAIDSYKTSFAVKDIKFGLMPCYGGTYRLRKKVGLVNAADLIFSGKEVYAYKAKELGLVDYIYKDNLSMEDIFYDLINTNKFKKKSSKSNVKSFADMNYFAQKLFFQKLREKLLKGKMKFYQAPFKILDVMEKGMRLKLESYLSSESQAFGELCISHQSRILQHLHLTKGKLREGSFWDCNVNIDSYVNLRAIVIGDSNIAGEILWFESFKKKSPRLVCKDIEGELSALSRSSDIYKSYVNEKRMTMKNFEFHQRMIDVSFDYPRSLKNDIIFDFSFKNLSSKDFERHSQSLLIKQVEYLQPEKIKEIDKKSAINFYHNDLLDEQRVIEVVNDKKNKELGLNEFTYYFKSINKIPVIINSNNGSVLTRVISVYIKESLFLLEEGVSVSDIADACLNFGMDVSPFYFISRIHFKKLLKYLEYLEKQVGGRFSPPQVLREAITRNCNSIDDLATNCKKMESDEIQQRIILPIINESAIILEDKEVDSVSLIDMMIVEGMGFPSYRGGPLRYFDSKGGERIIKIMDKFSNHIDHNRYFTSNFLRNNARDNKQIYE